MKRIIAAVVLTASTLLVAACDEPDDKCKPEEEGKAKHYDTGHIIECENGKWVLKNGVGFER